MKKGFFGAVLLINLLLLAFLLWGGALTHDSASLSPPLHPDQMKLLGFSPPPPSPVLPASAPSPDELAASAPPATTISRPAANTDPVPSNSATCMEWGEFSGADLASAKERLASLKLGSRLSQHEVEHSIGYWVYIPPLKNRAQVDAKIGQLKKLGVREFFIVKEKGKWQNAISLNVFKTKELAQKFLAHLKAKGVRSAVLGERQTRLKFTVFSLKNPGDPLISKLTKWQQDYTGIELKSAPCR